MRKRLTLLLANLGRSAISDKGISYNHLWNDTAAGLSKFSRSDLLGRWLPDPEVLGKLRPSIGKESDLHADGKQVS